MSQELRNNFLYPLGNYHGEFTLNNLAFDSNLQEFAQQVSYLCNLEANGKITLDDTYQEIKRLQKQLRHSKKELLDDTNFTPEQ